MFFKGFRSLMGQRNTCKRDVSGKVPPYRYKQFHRVISVGSGKFESKTCVKMFDRCLESSSGRCTCAFLGPVFVGLRDKKC